MKGSQRVVKLVAAGQGAQLRLIFEEDDSIRSVTVFIVTAYLQWPNYITLTFKFFSHIVFLIPIAICIDLLLPSSLTIKRIRKLEDK